MGLAWFGNSYIPGKALFTRDQMVANRIIYLQRPLCIVQLTKLSVLRRDSARRPRNTQRRGTSH